MDRPFRDLCPDADYRDDMTDDEFWEHVLIGTITPVYQETDPNGDYYDGPDESVVQPCASCGSLGACGYDSEGRALIHADDRDEEQA